MKIHAHNMCKIWLFNVIYNYKKFNVSKNYLKNKKS